MEGLIYMGKTTAEQDLAVRKVREPYAADVIISAQHSGSQTELNHPVYVAQIAIVDVHALKMKKKISV